MRYFGIFVTLAVLFATGCSSTTTKNLRTSQIVPAAQGTLEFGPGEGKNTELDLSVRHLAPAKRVASNATTYVVWAQPTVGDMSSIQNMGTLSPDRDLDASFTTVLPHRNFNIMVTPEPSAMVSRPSGPTVLEGSLSAVAE